MASPKFVRGDYLCANDNRVGRIVSDCDIEPNDDSWWVTIKYNSDGSDGRPIRLTFDQKHLRIASDAEVQAARTQSW